MIRRSAAALAATFSLVTIPAGAQNGTPIVIEAQPLPTAAVSYADLDLSKPAGLARLNARVERAASRLCSEDGVRAVAEYVEQRRCLTFAVESAQPQIREAVSDLGLRQYAYSRQIVVAAR